MKKSNKINGRQIKIFFCFMIICVGAVLLYKMNTNDIFEKNVMEQGMFTAEVDETKEVSINLGSGLYIMEVGKYSGAYVEDGSNEIVSDVMMITVKNEGEEPIQYAEITVPLGNEDAFFSMSTLMPGSTMILLEQNRKEYVETEYTTAVVENVVFFQDALGLCEDKVKLQILDGAINVTNISGKDISGDVIIYYKNSSDDVYYGGITYRIRIEGGLKKGEIRQVIAEHFSNVGSKIMFVTCGEE